MLMMGKSPVRQMLVKGLDGRTLCLQFESGDGVLSGADVTALVCARTAIPAHCVRLVTGSAVVSTDSFLTASENGSLPSCTLLLRLPGGKGGFGSLLRGAATKAGQKKTSNFDACRDMSGRRLRHVNAEKKLKDWKADAEERALEKTAEDFLKKATKAKEEDNGVFEELEKFRAETSHAMEEVELAVASGLVEARKANSNSKRKVEEEAAVLDKRARMWMGDEDEEDDSDSDEEDMIEDERPSWSGEAGDTDVAVTTPEQVEPSFGPSSASLLAVVENVITETEEDDSVSGVHSLEKVTVTTEITTTTTTETTTAVTAVTIDVKGDAAEDVASGEGRPETSPMEVVLSSHVQSSEKVTVTSETFTVFEADANGENAVEGVSNGGDRIESCTMEVTPGPTILKIDNVPEMLPEEPLDFSTYQSAEEMEVLGLERLKAELHSRGLKFGGSLSERAGRLFLLKSSPLEKLDKKHFAAKPKGVRNGKPLSV